MALFLRITENYTEQFHPIENRLAQLNVSTMLYNMPGVQRRPAAIQKSILNTHGQSKKK